MVIQKSRQLRIEKTAIRFTSRSAIRSLDASALQPDFKILWYVSIFQRDAYQTSFWMASARKLMGRSVRSFQSIGSRSLGAPKLLGVDHGQHESGIPLLFSDRREDPNTAPSNLQGGSRAMPLFVSHLDSMQDF